MTKFCCSAVLFLVGCGGIQQRDAKTHGSNASETAAVTNTAVRIASAYDGPKIRVAVGEFMEFESALELYRELGWNGLAPSLTDQITTGLVRSGRVAVLERQQLGKVIDNLKLEKEGSAAKYFDQNTTQKTGKLLGAQAILIGAVTEFEPDVSGVEGGLQIGRIGGLKYHMDKAVVGIDVRLVEQESGRILAAANGRGEISTSTVGGAARYEGISFGSQAWTQTPLGAATRAAAEMAVRKLVMGMAEIPWENKVVGVNGEKIFIGAGKDLNLKAGDTFLIVNRGKVIQSQDGQVLGYDETKVGTVKLTQVQQKLSIGYLLEGGRAQIGDLVRLPTEP